MNEEVCTQERDGHSFFQEIPHKFMPLALKVFIDIAVYHKTRATDLIGNKRLFTSNLSVLLNVNCFVHGQTVK